jgi:hypothetical protein
MPTIAKCVEMDCGQIQAQENVKNVLLENIYQHHLQLQITMVNQNA